MLFTMEEMERIDREMPHLEFTPDGIVVRSPENVGKEEAKRIRKFADDISIFGRSVKNIDMME